MGKIYTIGECLIDFIPSEKGIPLSDVSSFTRVAGGAPANVASCTATLGKETYFVGMVGKDSFGSFLEEELKKTGVNTEYLLKTDKAKTALAFVSLKNDGDRDFMFYRDPSSDMLLSKDDIQDIELRKDDILHFCSVSLIEAPVKYAHIALIEKARREKTLVSFDVNLRPSLYPNEETLKQTVIEFLPYSDLVKMSEEELSFITDEKDEIKAAKIAFDLSPNCNYLIITKGESGVTLYNRDIESVSKDAMKVEVVDTTGAGDCFIGCFLSKLLDNKISSINDFASILEFANKGAALSITKKGAIGAMPTLSDIENTF